MQIDTKLGRVALELFIWPFVMLRRALIVIGVASILAVWLLAYMPGLLSPTCRLPKDGSWLQMLIRRSPDGRYTVTCSALDIRGSERSKRRERR